jgi:hypothetical protein
LALPVGKLIVRTKKIKAQAQERGSEVRALHHMQLCQRAIMFPGAHFSLHKGHASWYTLKGKIVFSYSKVKTSSLSYKKHYFSYQSKSLIKHSLTGV